MPGSGTATFIDPDDYQGALRQAQIDLLVTSNGAFKARLTWTTLDRLRLLRGEEDLPRIGYVSLPSALVFIGFAARSGPPIHWAGTGLLPTEVIFHSRGDRFHQRTTGPSSWSLIGLSREDLARFGEALFGKAFARPAAGGILRPAARDAAKLRRLHAQACRLAEMKPRVLTHPEVARAIEQDLIWELAACLNTADHREDDAARQQHAAIMIRFEEVLAEHPGRPLPAPELSTLIGVSERTLRVCCAEFLGISPSRYVLLRRLKQLRAALREADPAAASVAGIAHSCGFTELGRFAGTYRAVYGETPSTTLRRSPGSGILGARFTGSA
jgi:AraC-like DNA-binding protein